MKDLEDGAGTIKLLLTISGTQGAETITDLVNYTTNTKERDDLYRSYVSRPSMADRKLTLNPTHYSLMQNLCKTSILIFFLHLEEIYMNQHKGNIGFCFDWERIDSFHL